VAIKNIFFPHPEWSAFTDHLRKKNRYRLNKKWEDFIQKILNASKTRGILIRKDRVFWRARIGEHWLPRPTWPDKLSSIYPHPLLCSKMGAPPTNKSKEGRSNPKGISYLYLSSDYKTSIAEVRPRVGAPVSVGKFKIIKNQTVLDTTSSVSEESDIEHIWKSINDSFSAPMAYYEDNLQYVSTQYLAELFKGAGFDGIKYKSSVRKGGYNLLLFNKKIATCVQCRLYYVEEIIYKTKGLGRGESRQEMDSRIYL
jgi:RES domain-containing protein